MATAQILWAALDGVAPQPTLIRRAREHFSVTVCTEAAQLSRDWLRVQPQILFFELRRWDPDLLQLLQDTKRAHMSVPILFLTTVHSEALAVWAFRIRVWNYLVQPVDLEEFEDNLRVLTRLAAIKSLAGRSIALPVAKLPAGYAVQAKNRSHRVALLAAAPDFLERHYSRRITAGEIAKHYEMDRYQFSRLFHKVFGLSFREYLLRFRIRKASQLLMQRPMLRVTNVAMAVGFNDPAYFARVFKRLTGVVPSNYISPDDMGEDIEG